MTLQLAVGEATACGPREENQDALRSVQPAAGLAQSKGYLFALADGVSQCQDGRLAAQSTVQALAMDYYATPETWTVEHSLDRLLLAQNRWLQAAGNGQPLLTTLTALVLRGRRFVLAHAGDCRAYRHSRQGLLQLTRDHVWQQPGMQHVLTRALGLEPHLVVDFSAGELVAGEQFLLLSDGVWAVLDEAALLRCLEASLTPLQQADRLVRAAHAAGSQDNASALVIRVEALPDVHWSDPEAVAWPVPPLLKAGQRFEGWQVTERRGESRYSLLYRVRDEAGRCWLLKTLPPRLRDDSQAAQALLMEEWFLRRVPGRAFAEVHPAAQRQHLYYVQRDYPGRTLEAQLQEEGPLALGEWLDCATRLLRAVGQLHRRNLVHRDIKPDNLHRGTDGELRLLDFGLAWCAGISPEVSGTPGTPSYIPPEAYAGTAPLPGHDLFAVGVTLFRLLTGRYPYGELEPFQTPRFGTLERASHYRPDLPAWLDRWLGRCLATDPLARFQTAEEALLQLEQGERQPPAVPRPLLEREPLKTWQGIASLSLLLNLLLVMVMLYRH